MTTPSFLDSTISPFRYRTSVISDVANLITDIETELTALGWTENPADTWSSPTNGTAYMKIGFTRASASRLTIGCSDDHGKTIRNGDVDIESAGNTTVDVFTGKWHFFLQSRRITRECYGAWLVDTTPETASNGPDPVCANSYRVGIATGQWSAGYLSMVDNLSTTNNGRMRFGFSGGLLPPNPIFPSGKYSYDDVMIAQNMGGTVYWAGRLPQTLSGPSAPAYDTDLTIPVDDAVNGLFRKVNVYIWTASMTYSMFLRSG